jgi:Asp-tRNA(Asn)/Glu-tRNA(Gln) amidotransferase A subunit family amidase
MDSTYPSEDTLVEDYLAECKQLFKSGFDKKKVRQFTKKYIDRQLHGPNLTESFDQSKLDSLKKLSALEVQSKILSGEVTYSEIVEQYHAIKAQHNNANNFLTWSRYQEPLKRAQEMDKLIQELGPEKAKEKFPLLGFVLTIKDCIYAKDTPTTGGLFINLDRVANQDPEPIQALKENGIVFTSKGNVPQMLFAFESINNLYGEATHGLDGTRSVGGSTGGDSAMLAFGYNNCALGSDVGGSLRIPALFNGICSLKCSSRRLSRQPQANFFSRSYGSDQLRSASVKTNRDVQLIIPVVFGPLAKKVEDLEAMMEVLCRDQTFDVKIPPLPWKCDISFTKRVGVFREHSMVEVGPTAKRVINESLDALKKVGYDIVELDLEDLMMEVIIASIMSFNKNDELFSVISGKTKVKETFGDLFKLAKLLHSMPLWVIRLVKWKEKGTRKEFILEHFLRSKEFNTQDLLEIQSSCYRRLEKKMKELNISGIVSPGMPMPAIKKGYSNQCLLACAYMFIWNFLDMPSGVLTVGKVREDEQYYETAHQDEMASILKKNAEDSAGLPMGVSVTSRAFQEEIVIQIMKDIQNNL